MKKVSFSQQEDVPLISSKLLLPIKEPDQVADKVNDAQ